MSSLQQCFFKSSRLSNLNCSRKPSAYAVTQQNDHILVQLRKQYKHFSLKRFGQKNFIRLVISFKAVHVKTSYAATYFSSGFEGLASRYEDLALGPFEDSDDSEEESLVEDL